MNSGAVIHITNPFRPYVDRTIDWLPEPITVRGWLDSKGIKEFDVPTVCIVNGQTVMRADWTDTEIGPDQACVFMALPADGGGKKNPLATLLTIAVLLAGNVVGGVVAGAIGGTLGGVIGGVATGLVVFGGTALISAIVPAPSARAGELRAPSEGSPTYSLEGQANAARLGAPIPEQFGRHKIYPDLIAREPWTRFFSNKQYLYQAHCLGVGEFDVEQIRIGDTDIGNFKEITYEIVLPGQAATLFNVNVIPRPEVSGQELLATNEQTGTEYIGPFILNPVGTVATNVQFDVVAPGGIGRANGTGGIDTLTASFVFEHREIDDDDQPIGSWIALTPQAMSAADFTAKRDTYGFGLPAGSGRFEVRARRTDERETDPQSRHQVYWTGLKAAVEGPNSFADVTLLLVQMLATDNLSSRNSRLVNVTQTRKLPVWDGGSSSWSAPAATSSIVWASAYIAKSAGELSDDRLVLDELAELDATLAARGDYFNGRFDRPGTVWDGVQTVTRCGRTVPTQPGGVLRLIRDEPQATPAIMFGPRNIVDGSFRTSWIMPSEDTADAVTVEFFNAKGWKWDEVTGAVAGSTADKPARVTLLGCTDEAHAQREADAMAHDNRYRRMVIEFETEMDGMLPSYGDEIRVTAELLRWGVGGDVEAWDPDANVLTLTEVVSFTDGVPHYLALRARDGSVGGKVEVTAGPQANQVMPVGSLPLVPYTGGDEERTYFGFGSDLEGWSGSCRVIGLEAREAGARVAVLAVREDSRAHPN